MSSYSNLSNVNAFTYTTNVAVPSTETIPAGTTITSTSGFHGTANGVNATFLNTSPWTTPASGTISTTGGVTSIAFFDPGLGKNIVLHLAAGSASWRDAISEKIFSR